MKYRKTGLIEAEQWTGDNPAVIAEFTGGFSAGWHRNKVTGELVIPTLEGDHIARAGDWIARGVNGEYWPIKPDIFSATYELAEPSEGKPT